MIGSLLVIGGYAWFANYEGGNAQGTDVSGTIMTDTVWDLAGSPYIVIGDVWVESGITLTIEPGVLVKFDGFYGMYVNGTLIAIGTETGRIYITSNMSTPDPGNWYKIQINSNGHAEVKYCNITYASSGIHLSGSSYNNITDNNISFNLWEGILLSSSSCNNITDNDISFNWEGIYLSSSSYNNITDNNISFNGEGIGEGIYLSSSSNNNITHNNISYNCYGINFEMSSNNNITNNNISWNDYDGFYLSASSENTIAGNEISNQRNGIVLAGSSGNTIAENDVISNWGECIYLQADSNYNTIANNTASNNSYCGINIDGSKNNLVIDNIASRSTWGIFLSWSLNTTLVNNQMTGDGIEIFGEVVDVWNTHSIDTSNTVNGKPVYYWKNQNGGTIPPGAGEVILANCTDIRIEGQNVSDGSTGILLGFSDNNYIANNTASSNNMYNIHLDFSEYNDLTNNTVYENTGFYFYYSSNNTLTNNKMSYNSGGITFFWSDFNTIANNYVFSNPGDGIFISGGLGNILKNNTVSNNWCGIRLISSNSHNITSNDVLNNWFLGIHLSSSSDENGIIDNTISNNSEYGLRISSSKMNEIVGNTIFKTDGYGLHLTGSSKNRIHHNNFIDNVDQAYDDMDDNLWDEGYLTGGNYWSDFDEPGEGAFDEYNGPDQNMPGSDGIVDLGPPAGGKNPYVIDPDSQDNYPLINLTRNFLFLYPGWNLISIPRIQPDTDPGVVLSSITGYYKAVQWFNITDPNDPWKHNCTTKPPHQNDLNSLDHMMGFWIYISEPGGVLFEYYGNTPPAPQNIPLHPGWNMVGYPSLSNRNRTAALNNLDFGVEVDALWTYDPTTQTWEDLGISDDFNLGRGYWIHATQECVWEVPL